MSVIILALKACNRNQGQSPYLGVSYDARTEES